MPWFVFAGFRGHKFFVLCLSKSDQDIEKILEIASYPQEEFSNVEALILSASSKQNTFSAITPHKIHKVLNISTLLPLTYPTMRFLSVLLMQIYNQWQGRTSSHSFTLFSSLNLFLGWKFSLFQNHKPL